MFQVAQFSDSNDRTANFKWVISTEECYWSTPWGKFDCEPIEKRIDSSRLRFYKLDNKGETNVNESED